MTNEEKVNKILDSNYYVTIGEKNAAYNAVLEMAQWKDEQFKEQLNSLKDEIQSNLCASSGFNDEYSRGYQDCGMKIMEIIDKILKNV